MSAPSHYVAILGSTNKTANVTYLEIGFPSMNRGKGSSSPLRDNLAYHVSGQVLCQALGSSGMAYQSTMWIKNLGQYVSPPYGASNWLIYLPNHPSIP